MKVYEQVFSRDQMEAIEIPDHVVAMLGLHRIAQDILGLFQYHEEVMVSIDKKFKLTREGDLLAGKPEVTISTKRWTFKGSRFVSQIKYELDTSSRAMVSGKIARCNEIYVDTSTTLAYA